MRLPQQLVGVIVCVALAGGAAGQAQTGTESPLIPQNASALEGVPAVRLDATKESATRRTLDRAEASRQSLKVRIINGQYFWASRENKPLTLSASGDFTYLSSTEPGQYVRFRQINDRITYVEHVDSAFGSVTYWGELRIVLGR